MSRGILAGLLALLLGAAAGCPPSSSSGTPAPSTRPAASEPGKTSPGGTTPKATNADEHHIPSGN
jgi:hypothetical protein